MKKHSFLLKSWLISLCIVSITLVLGGFSFYFFTAFFLEKNQKEAFDQSADEIVSHLEKDGFDKNFFVPYIEKGYLISLHDQKGEIFSSDNAFQPTENENSRREDEQNSIPYIEEFSSPALPQNFFLEKSIIHHGNERYQLSLYYPISVTLNTYQEVLVKALPFLIGIGILVSAIAARFVSSFFSHKIRDLNHMINSMGKLAYEPVIQEENYDEMMILENHLNEMYRQLNGVLKKAESDYRYIELLESERQVFIRGATHELKTPIMAMGTMIEGMLSHLPEYENHDEYLQHCYQQLNRMTLLVNELLEISKVESLHMPEKTNVLPVLESTLEDLDILIQDKYLQTEVQISNTLTYELPKKDLKKIFSNLIGNAVLYSKPNTKICCYSQEMTLKIINRSEYLAAIENVDIFRPFVSNHECDTEYTGHGLGLYVVKRILEKYDYKINYEIQSDQISFVIQPNQIIETMIRKEKVD